MAGLESLTPEEIEQGIIDIRTFSETELRDKLKSTDTLPYFKTLTWPPEPSGTYLEAEVDIDIDYLNRFTKAMNKYNRDTTYNDLSVKMLYLELFNTAKLRLHIISS